MFESEVLRSFEFVVRYTNDNDFKKGLNEVLNCYKSAHQTDKEKFWEILLSTTDQMTEDENKMWNVKNNVPNLENKDNYDKAIKIFKHIGDNLEISTKHITQELYALIRLIDGKDIRYETIKKQDFGVTINNIIEAGYFQEILTLDLPNNIKTKLSDWRNISYHSNYSIKDDVITCSYGKNNITTFEMRMSDFEKYTHCIIRGCNIFSIARALFVFNYSFDIPRDFQFDANLRNTIRVYQLEVQLLSQQFKLENIKETNNQIEVDLVDINNTEDKQVRIIHCSQLLINIWCLWKKDTVKINYYKDNTNQYTFSVDGNTCLKIYNGENDLSLLAEKYIIQKN